MKDTELVTKMQKSTKMLQDCEKHRNGHKNTNMYEMVTKTRNPYKNTKIHEMVTKNTKSAQTQNWPELPNWGQLRRWFEGGSKVGPVWSILGAFSILFNEILCAVVGARKCFLVKQARTGPILEMNMFIFWKSQAGKFGFDGVRRWFEGR